MSDIEDTQPIEVLAGRTWSGTHWHYPHIEQMCKEMRELREAVNVLAVYAHRRTLQAQKLDTMPYIKQQVFLGTVGQAKDAVLANPIAAEAVREAGR